MAETQGQEMKMQITKSEIYLLERIVESVESAFTSHPRNYSQLVRIDFTIPETVQLPLLVRKLKILNKALI